VTLIGTPPPIWLNADSIGENILVADAVKTLSPLDNIAGIESLVAVPGPLTAPPSANLALFTVFIAVAMLESIVPIVVAIAARFPGKGTPDADLIPSAIATPEFIAICANANTLEAIAKDLSDSPIASVKDISPPVISDIACNFVSSIEISFCVNAFFASLYSFCFSSLRRLKASMLSPSSCCNESNSAFF